MCWPFDVMRRSLSSCFTLNLFEPNIPFVQVLPYEEMSKLVGHPTSFEGAMDKLKQCVQSSGMFLSCSAYQKCLPLPPDDQKMLAEVVKIQGLFAFLSIFVANSMVQLNSTGSCSERQIHIVHYIQVASRQTYMFSMIVL